MDPGSWFQRLGVTRQLDCLLLLCMESDPFAYEEIEVAEVAPRRLPPVAGWEMANTAARYLVEGPIALEG